MGEIWKPIKGFEGFYEISNEGRIKNSRRNKILRFGYDSDGYPHYTFSKNGKRKTYTIHKLVAIHFIDNPFGYKCINHKDENKTNNRAENLEWCTILYNNNYGTKNHRTAQKISKPVVQIENGEIVAKYRSATEASEQTGINYWHICECCRNTGKRHRAGGYHWNFLMNMEETNNESI